MNVLFRIIGVATLALIFGAPGGEPPCGNGILDAGEQCDDGNVLDGDGCSSICLFEPFCGDGNVDLNEACDDGNNLDGDGCSATCMIESYCGDGILDAGEQCDDGNSLDGDGCSAKCELEGGGEGCTPGYWKQPQHFDSYPSPYTPTTLFVDAFGVDAFPGMNLVDVAGQGGGGLKALGRHAVAALLSSASSGVSYDLSTAQVITTFQNAYASGDYEAAKNALAGYNEQSCPLN